MPLQTSQKLLHEIGSAVSSSLGPKEVIGVITAHTVAPLEFSDDEVDFVHEHGHHCDH